jgi:hypothetical protein
MAKEIVVQTKDSPPKVEKGKRPVWHDEYSYNNSKGTKITIRGHWEVIDVTEKEAAKAKREADEAKKAAKGEKKS